MAIMHTLLFIYSFLIITGAAIFCLDIAYIEEHSNCRFPCKHVVPDNEVHRVIWFKSRRDDIFKNGDSAVVSWDGNSQPHTTENYGIDTDFSLFIYNMSIHQEGIYRCYVVRNVPGNPSHYDFKIISYGEVKSAQRLAVQYATRLRLPCSYNLTVDRGFSVLWYKSNITDSFKSDNQPVASCTDSERHVLGEYNLTDDFSLEIQNVSFENEAVYRCIAVSKEETKPSASDTNVTVYALPVEEPLIQHFTQDDASFINCSVDHVYPLLYPELNMITDQQSYEIRNEDGTYNTSIRGKVSALIYNTTVECSFPYFNYTGKSSLYISFNFSVKNEAPHPKDCSASTCPNQAPSIMPIVGKVFWSLVTCLLIAAALFLWIKAQKDTPAERCRKFNPRDRAHGLISK